MRITEYMEQIEKNLGLVHLCANKFRSRGIEYEELYSAGCMGLIKASKSFDESRGVKFSTYAVPVILGEIKRLFRDGGTIKISRSIKELSMKVSREREKFIKQKGREPHVDELAQILGVDAQQIAEAVSSLRPVLSLTGSSEDNEGQIDVRVESPDEEITDLLSLRQIMTELSDTEKKLIYFRYYKNLTQSQTAELLGISQVQVSRKEKKLLTYMREKLLE
ncbi:MAG: sigma-70 family RNA polymerase sigma factor [Oscillospiraceae bacterium]|nr:sigma-70 family RNA polymerase sigma factor [Oscillospiraceae bacterium]